MNALKIWMFLGIIVLAASLSAQDKPDAFVKVFGTGKVTTVPDEILFSYTIISKDAAVAEARKKNKALATTSITYLKSLKIPERHIQTKYMSLSPVMENSRSDIVKHYRANQTITVCLDDVETFEKVVDQLLAFGITQINNPTFRTTKHAEKLIEAQQKALVNARKEAEWMAVTLGMRVGDAFQIIDVPVSSRRNNPNAYESRAASNNDGGEGGIALGEMLIRADVEVRFLLVK